ncbi:4-aminobutyrate--2-oxoglutarate transaminase [Shewanella surugensis]|uniref:4-aminobutyrate--2-oxoglutarate transaminase n=1 Tax=Shewanella surugensis TaxID=212020 RepID=A0ABT0L7Y6_9GAMM|nr:4-aminobutyrate--2-oxoglutarate transaminase [Shewanella surugensis]MCL1123811.1 4-aminobutyrate--2-oxoglutarate transaminase [Shewanella surugensis]
MSTTNDALIQRRQKAVANGVSQIHPIYVDKAENATIWDVEGRELIDFTGGIAVLNTGHLHPNIKQAVIEQLDRFSHTCFMVLGYESYIEVCEKVNSLVPGDFDKKSALFTSGSEAVENAVKVARAYTQRVGVIAFTSAYHGRTLAALALTGKVNPYSTGMGLMSGAVFRAEFPCSLYGISDDDAIASIERIFKNDAAPSDIAAIIIEPVQGEGGFYVASPAFMRKLRALCDREGILLIADEVQTGAGRTGTFFAMEQMGVCADISTFAKSIAGGVPLSGITGRADIMDSIEAGGLGGTYGGNPIACVAALAVIDTFSREKLLQRANDVGKRLKQSLTKMQKNHQQIIDIRGLGAMVAVELMENGKPSPEYCAQILIEARERGLILLSCGAYGNVLRLMVPLTAPDEQIDKGLAILKASFDSILP